MNVRRTRFAIFSNLLCVGMSFVIQHGLPIKRSCTIASSRTSNVEPFQKYIETTVPTWLKDRNSLPFECTGCGKCCTQAGGQVVMSPDEVEIAAKSLNSTATEFIRTYSSAVLRKENGDTWMRLKQLDDETTGGTRCIFFDKATRHCQIYQARPIQCSAYPFLPNIVATVGTWNDECRAADDDDVSELPKWTPVLGGCEGMKPISSSSESLLKDGQVPMDVVYRYMFEMQQSYDSLMGKEDP